LISAKGGCGATSIACHSAVTIGHRAAKRGKRALLMDLDLSTGLSRFLMKSENEYSVLDAVRNLHKLDPSYWNALVYSKFPGLDVLSAPENLTSDEYLDRGQVEHLISFTRRYYDWVVVDLGRGLGQLGAAVLPEISQIYIVATHEIASLHVTQKIFRSLDHSGYPRHQVRLVINRAPDSLRATAREIEGAIGTPVFAALPNDYKALYECYSSGRLLSKRTKLARGIQLLAAGMMGEKVEPKRNLAVRILRGCAERVLRGRRDQEVDRAQVIPSEVLTWQEALPSGTPSNAERSWRKARLLLKPPAETAVAVPTLPATERQTSQAACST
jgi:pilus assembly protein CpaE